MLEMNGEKWLGPNFDGCLPPLLLSVRTMLVRGLHSRRPAYDYDFLNARYKESQPVVIFGYVPGF